MSAMRLTEWEPTSMEEAGAVPRYRVGNIVLTVNDEVGVVERACVVFNGCSLDEDARINEPFRHGYPPAYALGPISGFQRPGRCAWWTAEEFKAVRRFENMNEEKTV